MLTTETKRRIDACRDVLVGKLPLPTDQVELITLALIYKFMDDLDEESVKLGGKRSFFTGELAKYRWRNLEATFQVFNLTNTEWREAQFDTNSCVRREVGNDPRCPAAGGGEGIEDVNFTPGNPTNVQGGLTLFF